MTLALNPAQPTPREIAERVNAILLGRINTVGTVTLEASADSTTVDALIGSSSAVFLTPQTAHAAAEIGNGTLYVDPSDYVSGQSFTIRHANNSQADRAFGYVVLG